MSAAHNPMPVTDAAAFFGCCAKHFGQLAAIFKAINDDPDAGPHLTALAGAGLYLAADLENTADCWREQIEESGVHTDGQPQAVKPSKRGGA